jgi:hypothetical protein
MSRLLEPRRLASALVLAVGLALVVFAFASGVSQDDSEPVRDPAIEYITPDDGDQALRQTPIVVDLAAGYTGELTISGQTLPTEEVVAVAGPNPVAVEPILVTRFDPGSNTLTYVPQDGAPIEALEPTTRMAVRYWRLDESRDSAKVYTWTFDVS